MLIPFPSLPFLLVGLDTAIVESGEEFVVTGVSHWCTCPLIRSELPIIRRFIECELRKLA